MSSSPIKSFKGPVANYAHLSSGEGENHLRAFEVWYNCSQSLTQASKILGVGPTTLMRWRDRFGWVERAEARRQTEKERADQIAADRASDMLETHFDAADILLQAGITYLKEHPIDNARDAINAIKLGIELQRRTREMPDWVIRIKKAPEEELIREAQAIIEEARSYALAVESGEATGNSGRACLPGNRSEEPIDVEFESIPLRANAN